MRERAEGVGGTLAVEAMPGAGTTVRFEVPLAAAASS
jgi:signal transduction histidine kinase